MKRLRMTDVGQVVRLRDLNHGQNVRASGVSDIPSQVRKSFGSDERIATRPSFIELPGGLDGHGRRLQLQGGSGASFVDRTYFHGQRTFLSIIVGSADAGNGDVRNWGSSPCQISAVREQMWGTPEGHRIPAGCSRFAYNPICKATDGVCKYNLRDHLRHLSRNAVLPISTASSELFLPVVRNWPADFCNWPQIWSAIRAAVADDGRLSMDNFQHVIAFVPKHCAVGQGERCALNSALRPARHVACYPELPLSTPRPQLRAVSTYASPFYAPACPSTC
jgi:hypothetical protein